MRIELSKNILEISTKVIAEVDFFEKEKSPYIKLLEGLNSREDIENHLENKGFTDTSIRNIIKNLESLKVIDRDNGTIHIENGFPERELGKYQLSYYYNNTKMPFEYFYKSIERKCAVNMYQQKTENIKDLPAGLSDLLNKTTKEVKILKLLKNKGIYTKQQKNIKLNIIFDDKSKNPWMCEFGDKKVKAQKIDLKQILGAKWNENYNSYEEDFENIKDDEKAITNFTKDYPAKQIEIPHYGKMQTRLQNISISPTEDSQKIWFMHLLKKEIQSRNNYCTKDELEQTWNNIFYTTPQISRLGNLSYNYQEVLNTFNKRDEMHWLIKTATDLNPFSEEKKLNDNTASFVIQKSNNTSIENILSSLQLEKAKTLIIYDRYINTKRHFDAIFAIKDSFSHLNIRIFSTKFYKTEKSVKEKILQDCNNKSIERIVKNKNEIPHTRYWTVDNRIYNVSNSIDFIKINKDTINSEHTFFNATNPKYVENSIKQLGENGNV